MSASEGCNLFVIYLFIFCVYGYFIHTHVYALSVPVASPGQGELGLPMVVSHSVGTENPM